jgi:hypothetical protein
MWGIDVWSGHLDRLCARTFRRYEHTLLLTAVDSIDSNAGQREYKWGPVGYERYWREGEAVWYKLTIFGHIINQGVK